MTDQLFLSIVRYVLWLSIGVLVYIYAGYYLILKVVTLLFRGKPRKGAQAWPTVSVIIAAYNEGHIISGRLANLLEMAYPGDCLEILVASDGSKDDTVDKVRSFGDRRVRCLEYLENRGRALTHNEAVGEAGGEILVFTDAETVFERNFLSKLVQNYNDPAVGCISGNLRIRSSESAVAVSEGMYFRYELAIRTLESRLGILATGTGACFSVRKALFKPLEPIDDIDFATPIDVVKSGKLALYAEEAVAWDWAPSSPRDQIRNRTRMTAKNFIGTVRRCRPWFFFRHPYVGWALISHKFLRWLSGYFFLGALTSNLFALGKGAEYHYLFLGQLGFYLLAVVGYIGDRKHVAIPLAAQVFSFLTAVYAMSLGVLNSLTGRIPVRWGKPSSD